jgi:hypothetical protein
MNEELVKALRRTIEVLRSYQYGEPSRDMARQAADSAEAVLQKALEP